MTDERAMPVRPAKCRVALAVTAGVCWLVSFVVSPADAQGYSSGFRAQSPAPVMGSRGSISGRGMHDGYRQGWGGHRGLGLRYEYGMGVPLGVIEAPYDVIGRDDNPGDGRGQRPPRRKAAHRERAPQKPITGTTASGIRYSRYAPNTYPVCARGDGAMSGECDGRPFVADLGGNGPPAQSQNHGSRRTNGAAAATRNYLPGEIVADTGALSDSDIAALARRHRLQRIASQSFSLTGSTVSLFRIVGRRPVEDVQRELRADAAVRSVQPNFRYLLQDQATAHAASEGDAAQYALVKLRLPEAHTLAHGKGVTIAVIDSAIDAKHPELAGSIAESFDALGSKEGPHVHGTGIAGAIVAHARLMGGAPSAKILAIRAFAVAQGAAESTSFAILRSLDYAGSHGADIINMSFAGPKDALVGRGIAAVAAKGIVMVAASGNAGPKSPPLYPAADANVIAVSATDADDHLFAASNRGGHIAVAAPGVDIFLPAPGGKYQMTSGTSFAAAYVSSLAALVLERDPALKPGDVRALLTASARDLGVPGRDDLFGAGEADAYAAVRAVTDGAVAAVGSPPPVIPVSDAAPAAPAEAAAATTGRAVSVSEPQPVAHPSAK